ncbi:MAG: translation initiation factor IF-2 [Treponema sp.]|nr:translation initiation factor IF-2 [Treponema sp.]
MAEELDSTQKPKAELIKRVLNEPESSDRGVRYTPASGRKKVVVKKKAPAPPLSHQGPSAPVRKSPVKVVAARETAAEEEGFPDVSKDAPKQGLEKDGSPVSQAITPKAPRVPEPPSMPGKGTVHQKAKPQEQDRPSGSRNAVSSFPVTQRPAVVAGRVGGKFVGPKYPRQDTQNRSGPSSVRQRPTGLSGKVGGKPMGPRNTEAGQPNNRLGIPGSPRPNGKFGVGQRPRGPGRPGLPQGGTPRPGGFGGPRPGMGRVGGPLRTGAGASSQNPPAVENKGPVKKTFKSKKPLYVRREKELEMEEKLLQTKKKIAHIANPVPKSIDIMEVVSVSELARKMNLKASDLIQKLMSMGMLVTINQQIDAETATLLAAEFGADVRIISLYDETLIETEMDDELSMDPRPPVVTVMGHVDHGKTKLLDAIRSADVVSGEFGGITQHIGAYTVDTIHGRITFLDTPGHEAFTRMRARGAQVTDIVVLVVAADDGVMPQTVEAINHAKEAGVPIIVGINKIDKPEANPDRVKSQLSELGLQPEAWGGQTMFVEVSALRKEGIDKLIDSILLEAEILDLKANYNRAAEGKVLESRIDHGRGIVATVIVEKGTLKIGDSFVAGIWPGKVRALFNDKGEKVEVATPSMPIEVLGFEGIPNAGDPLQVVEEEKQARSISGKRQELKRFEDAKNVKKITLDNLYDTISDGAIQELKVIIKADVQGSAEALRSSLEKLSTKEVRLNVIQALPGAINEGDVDLAIASNAIIIGFNVRPVPKAKVLADQEKVDIRKYNIIYKAVEEIQQAMEGMLKPDTKEEVIATVEVRDTFKTPKFGTIAGCYVLTGMVKRSASVHVIRDAIVIYTGKIASLRRFKDDVREVAASYECGMGIEGFDSFQVNDQLEVFEMIEVARKLS